MYFNDDKWSGNDFAAIPEEFRSFGYVPLFAKSRSRCIHNGRLQVCIDCQVVGYFIDKIQDDEIKKWLNLLGV